MTSSVVSGYIIANVKGQYLDRNGRWRYRQGPREAFVHDEKIFSSTGRWIDAADVVYEAQYNPATTWAEVTGPPIKYMKMVLDVMTKASAVQAQSVPLPMQAKEEPFRDSWRG